QVSRWMLRDTLVSVWRKGSEGDVKATVEASMARQISLNNLFAPCEEMNYTKIWFDFFPRCCSVLRVRRALQLSLKQSGDGVQSTDFSRLGLGYQATPTDPADRHRRIVLPRTDCLPLSLPPVCPLSFPAFFSPPGINIPRWRARGRARSCRNV